MDVSYLGIEVRTDSGSKCVKATMVAISCDLPARSLVLNMKQFNGAQGCHMCEDTGKTTNNNPLFRWWPYESGSTQRTKSTLIEASAKATERKQPVSC